MRHRAKCRLCSTVIEVNAGENIQCACGEIHIDRTNSKTMYGAVDYENMIAIDEDGDEHPINVVERMDRQAEPDNRSDTPQFALDQLIERIEGLPQHAMQSFITHYDYLSLLYLLKALAKEMPR